MTPDAQKNIQIKLKQLPMRPGVYKMLDRKGDILYIGKAKQLKNRVSSYFKGEINHPKTAALVARIADFDVILTRSETEALLLEQSLIKEIRPPYNISMRDDKSYLYVYLTQHPHFPRLTTGRGLKREHVFAAFGPFPSGSAAKQSQTTLHKLFMLRSCEDAFFKQQKRPCMEYQIKRCSAPCVGHIDEPTYQEQVRLATQFMLGKTHQVTDVLVEKMNSAAEALHFELAAHYRDQLALLSKITAQQAIYQQQGEADVWAMTQQHGLTALYVVHVRSGQILGGQSYFAEIDSTLSPDEQFSSFLASFYFQFAQDFPQEIITNPSISELESFEDALKVHAHKKITCKHLVREHRAEWLQLARMNAEASLKRKLESHLLMNARFEALSQIMNKRIRTMECFDISHTQGESTVASCVVFNQEGPVKRDYRIYNITGVTAGDDYAAMKHVLTRRYSKKQASELPDLIIVDGGKGQLAQAVEVMQALDLSATLLGVSKGEYRKAGLETLHFIDAPAITPGDHHPALHLINQIRDEAHRFAITKHKKKRDKKRGQSVLEAIPGLGPVKRQALLHHFGGLQQLLGASEQDIAKVPGIGTVFSKEIYNILHK